VEDSREGIIM